MFIVFLKQLESGFKKTINWDKYQSKKAPQEQNIYLAVSIDPSFQRVNRLSIFSFKDGDGWKNYKQHYLSTAEIKDYNVVKDNVVKWLKRKDYNVVKCCGKIIMLWNVVIDERNFVVKPIGNNLKTCDNIRKIATVQGDDYTTGCFLDFPWFKNTIN